MIQKHEMRKGKRTIVEAQLPTLVSSTSSVVEALTALSAGNAKADDNGRAHAADKPFSNGSPQLEKAWKKVKLELPAVSEVPQTSGDKLLLLHNAALSPRVTGKDISSQPPPEASAYTNQSAQNDGPMLSRRDDSPARGSDSARGRGGGRGSTRGRGRGRGRRGRPPAAAKASQELSDRGYPPEIDVRIPRPNVAPRHNVHTMLGPPPNLPPGVTYTVRDMSAIPGALWGGGGSGRAGLGGLAGLGNGARRFNPLDDVPEALRPIMVQQLMQMNPAEAPWLNNPLAVSLFVNTMARQLQEQQARREAAERAEGAWNSPWQQQQSLIQHLQDQQKGKPRSQRQLAADGANGVASNGARPVRKSAAASKLGKAGQAAAFHEGSPQPGPLDGRFSARSPSPTKLEAMRKMADLEGPINRQQYNCRAQEMEKIVQQQQAKLGDKHPRLGASVMVLCKLYLKVGGEEGLRKASEALNTAWDILTKCQRELPQRVNPDTDKALHYILDHINSLSGAIPARVSF